MLRSNLAVLLAERGLKITRVANDTGISRTTLTGLTQNSSKMVQFETVDTLCQYLEVEPDSFFDYVPFSMDFNIAADFDNSDSDEEDLREGHLYWEIDGYLNISEKMNQHTVSYTGYAESYPAQDPNETLNVHLKVVKTEEALAQKYFDMLSTAFSTDVKTNLLSEAWESLKQCAKDSNSPKIAEFSDITIEFTSNEKFKAVFPF